MTLNELIDALDQIRTEHDAGEWSLAMSRDPEGNGFHTLEAPFHSIGRKHDSNFEHVENASEANTLVLWPCAALYE